MKMNMNEVYALIDEYIEPEEEIFVNPYEDEYFFEEDDDFDYEGQLRDYYNKYIKGKSREEITVECLDMYSDMYKDVNGVRPHFMFE